MSIIKAFLTEYHIRPENIADAFYIYLFMW